MTIAVLPPAGGMNLGRGDSGGLQGQCAEKDNAKHSDERQIASAKDLLLRVVEDASQFLECLWTFFLRE